MIDLTLSNSIINAYYETKSFFWNSRLLMELDFEMILQNNPQVWFPKIIIYSENESKAIPLVYTFFNLTLDTYP